MKSILIAVDSDIGRDPRVTRQILALKDSYRVVTLGQGYPPIQGIEHFKLRKTPSTSTMGKARLIPAMYANPDSVAFKRFDFQNHLPDLQKKEFDLVIANDPEMLPLAFSLPHAKVLFDAHEYSPRQVENRLQWRLTFKHYFHGLCRKYLSLVDRMLTVSEEIADEYERNYHVTPAVMTNAASYHSLSPSEVDHNAIRVLHHGNANPSRSLERMIQAFSETRQTFQLDLMLMVNDSTKRYYQKLSDLVSNSPRVRLLDAVSPDQIVPAGNQYDIGLFVLPPLNFNYTYALPNKFFEFIQSRLALVIGPTPPMKRLVDSYNLGVVTGGFLSSDIATALNSLSVEQIERFKKNAHSAASELSAEVNSARLLRIVSELIGD